VEKAGPTGEKNHKKSKGKVEAASGKKGGRDEAAAEKRIGKKGQGGEDW